MDNFIKGFVKDGFISPAQGRLIELFILGTIFSFLIGVVDGGIDLLNGQAFDITVFATTFATTTLVSIMAGLKKYLRDLKKGLSNK